MKLSLIVFSFFFVSLPCCLSDIIDVQFDVSSPIANVFYDITELICRVHVELHPEGIVSNLIRANPSIFDVCRKWDQSDNTEVICCSLIEFASCEEHFGKPLALKTLPNTGPQEFHVWIEIRNDKSIQQEVIQNEYSIDFKNLTLHRIPYVIGKDLEISSNNNNNNLKISNHNNHDDEKKNKKSTTVLGIHFSHDAHIAIVIDGIPKLVFELERFMRKRYFDSTLVIPSTVNEQIRNTSIDYVINIWQNIGKELIWNMKDLNIEFINPVDILVFDFANSPKQESNKHTINAITQGLSSSSPLSMFNSNEVKIVIVDHHESHAALGLYDAHRELGLVRPLIFSYDGGGNDGYSGCFSGEINMPSTSFITEFNNVTGGSLRRISKQRIDEIPWGNAYAGVGAALPEVMGRSIVDRFGQSRQCSHEMAGEWMPLAGKLMGYAGLGVVKQEYVDKLKKIFEFDRSTQASRDRACFTLDVDAFLGEHRIEKGTSQISRQDQRNIAAAAQRVMEDSIVDTLKSYFPQTPSSSPSSSSPYDGIVISGGCALNVRVNSVVASHFPHLPIHIPAAPSDCGIAVGAAWIVTPPPLTTSAGELPKFNLHFLGPRLFDVWYPKDSKVPKNDLFDEFEVIVGDKGLEFKGGHLNRINLDVLGSKLGARKIFSDDDGDGIDNQAGFELLAQALVDENILGVVRGRSEHGPRALGHRSLLSIPAAGMKERMNFLKHREWYRPVAPILAQEEADRIFVRDGDQELYSPFMSFAPKVRPHIPALLPALAHVDNTARPQTVSKDSDAWMHDLLFAVKKASRSSRDEEGSAVLINTSFNTRGYPILNSAMEALELLRTCRELDMVLIEGWLFKKSEVIHL